MHQHDFPRGQEITILEEIIRGGMVARPLHSAQSTPDVTITTMQEN